MSNRYKVAFWVLLGVNALVLVSAALALAVYLFLISPEPERVEPVR